MSVSRHIDPIRVATLVALLLEAKHAVEDAIFTTQGDEMYKDDKNLCMARIDQARSKLAYAWNELKPFMEE